MVRVGVGRTMVSCTFEGYTANVYTLLLQLQHQLGERILELYGCSPTPNTIQYRARLSLTNLSNTPTRHSLEAVPPVGGAEGGGGEGEEEDGEDE